MSDVRQLWIEGPAGRIEAALRAAEQPRAAVVLAHPHPLYGGTLHNPVIFHADRELNRAGMTTLRFNFRGVGGSEGDHDEGRGEVRDLSAAVDWLRGLGPRLPLVVVGYSFGSWCAARLASADPGIAGLVAIGLPVRIYSFDLLDRVSCPMAVVQGELDEFGSPAEVAARIEGLQPPVALHIIEGAEHLFPGRAPEAGRAVRAAVEDCLSRPAADRSAVDRRRRPFRRE